MYLVRVQSIFGETSYQVKKRFKLY